MGLTMTGLSLGGMVLVPFSVYLLSHFGLRTTLPILGIVFWLIVVPTAVFIIKQRPSDVGQLPDGEPSVTPAKIDPAYSKKLCRSNAGLDQGRSHADLGLLGYRGFLSFGFDRSECLSGSPGIFSQ